MSNQESQMSEQKEYVFAGKRGERLTISPSQLLFETKREILLINLRSIPSFFCEKSGRYYKIRISSRSDSDITNLKSMRSLMLLKAEDTKKLLAVLKIYRT